jgi:agmatinase
LSHTRPDNFLGLPSELADYRRARFAVLPVGYDATCSYMGGTRHGPRAIITASQQVECYDIELGAEFIRAGIATLDPLEPCAGGPAAMVREITAAATVPVRQGKFLLTLGGEHSITAGTVAAVARRHRRLSVLQIDAHADMRQSYEGSPDSHACVMRRIHDMGLPIVSAGIRSYSADEARFMKRHGLTPLRPADLADEDQLQAALSRLSPQVYVTIDIDGFDPAFAPGTGTPEPGGLSWDQVVGLLTRVARERTIVAADIVEVSPLPGQVVTEFLAARLAYKLMCLVQAHE